MSISEEIAKYLQSTVMETDGKTITEIAAATQFYEDDISDVLEQLSVNEINEDQKSVRYYILPF